MRKYRRNQKNQKDQNPRNPLFNERERSFFQERQTHSPRNQNTAPTHRGSQGLGSQGLMEEPFSRNEQISRWLSPQTPPSALDTPEPRHSNLASTSEWVSAAHPQLYSPSGNGWHTRSSPPGVLDSGYENGHHPGLSLGPDSSLRDGTYHRYHGPVPTVPQLARANERSNRAKLFEEEYRYAGMQQEYQPPSCGPDIREPLYKPTNGHPELSVDTNLANSVLPPPWDYNHHETRVVNLPFRFDPEAPEFVPMANKEEVEQEDDEEVKKKPMVPWLIVGN